MAREHRLEIRFIYVESKTVLGEFLYHSETTLGDVEANATAADLTAKGSRVVITDRPVTAEYLRKRFSKSF